MQKSIILSLLVAMPMLAQEPVAAQETAPAPAPQTREASRPAKHGARKTGHPKRGLARFDANKDGQLDDQELAAVKAAFEANMAKRHEKLLEKFDANKDGQLDDQEKAAMKAAREAHKAERQQQGPRRDVQKPQGPRSQRAGQQDPRGRQGDGSRPDMRERLLEKFDTNKDGQLDDQEKAAMKAAREARKAERRQQGFRRHGERGSHSSQEG